LKRHREMLIESLIAYRQKKGHDITAVFDGWKTGEGREMHSVVGGVRVIYTRIGEKADAVIKRIISSVKREWIVVSADREIADHAWAAGSIPVAAEDFLQALERSGNIGIHDELAEDVDDSSVCRRKGNPRQLSRKRRAVARALSKL